LVVIAMYGFILRRFGRVAADLFTPLWYAALILATGYCAFEPQATFSYLRL
jgi:hypothetical protein